MEVESREGGGKRSADHRSVALCRDATAAREDHNRKRLGVHKKPTPKRIRKERTRCKEKNVAHPKWRSRSSVSMAAGVDSSISMFGELEACGAERGMLQTCHAVRVWKTGRRAGQKILDESPRRCRSWPQRCGPHPGPACRSS